MLTSLLAAFNNVYAIAAVWIGLAFLASAISLRLGLSVALVEILVGVAAGNPSTWLPTAGSTSWPASAASC